MNMKFYHKLPIPQDVKAHYPVTDSMKAVKAKRDKEIKDVFEGKSDKFLLVIGPCSADRNDSVLDYIGRLKKVSEQVEDKIIIIPRIYTNKPRTTGDGYKGMLHQPDPNSHPDMLKGIVAIRQLHMSSLRDYGLSSARCSIPTITGIFRICFHTLPSAQDRLKISSTDLRRADLMFPSDLKTRQAATSPL